MTTQTAPRPGPGASAASRTLGLVLVLLVGAQFMISMDATIVNVALPSVADDLDVDQLDLGWVVNAYALAFGGLLLLGARLGDRYGRRLVFVAGMVVFTLGSLWCGLAGGLGPLVAARAVQGVGAALMSPVAMSLILVSTEGPLRHRALGWWSAMSGVAGSVGMLFGGWLSEVSWRWNFLVNVPIGVLATVVGWVLISESRLPRTGRPDLLGALLSTAGLSLAVYGVVQTEELGWTDPGSGGLLVVAVLLLVAFAAWQAVAQDPLVPLRVFRNRSVAIGNPVTALVGAVGQITYFTLTLYLQRVLGWSPLQSGLAFLPVGVGIFLASIPFARYVRAVGLRNLLLGGFALMVAGLLVLARTPQDGPVALAVLVPATVWGVGFGLTQSGAFVAAAQGVGSDLAGVASGLIATTYRVGGALGLGAMVTVATAHTAGVSGPGTPGPDALAAGYSWAFAGGAVLTVLGAVAAWWLPSRPGDDAA